jgi:hypothetical protein
VLVGVGVGVSVLVGVTVGVGLGQIIGSPLKQDSQSTYSFNDVIKY